MMDHYHTGLYLHSDLLARTPSNDFKKLRKKENYV
jgi:hypothetical protein